MIDALKTVIKACIALVARVFVRLERKKVVVFYGAPDFERKARAISGLLNAHQIPSIVRTGSGPWKREITKQSKQFHIAFWNRYPLAYLPRRYVFINAEPMHVLRWQAKARLRAIEAAIEVWDYTTASAAITELTNKAVTVVPFGYASYYEHLFREHIHGMEIKKDIDVLFYGVISDRRKHILAELEHQGIRVHVIPWQKFVSGRDLSRLIARSRIVLSIFQYEDPLTHVVDLARLDLLLSNRCLVVHERPVWSASDKGFMEFVPNAPADEIGALCLSFLNDESMSQVMADRSYTWFRSELPLERFIPFSMVSSQFAD